MRTQPNPAAHAMDRIGRWYRRRGWAPRRAAVAFGATVGAAAWLAALAILLLDEDRNRRLLHQANVEAVATVLREGDALLRQLSAESAPDCDEASLRQIRRRLFAHPWFGEAGIFDADGALACTSTDGLMARPVQVADYTATTPSGMKLRTGTRLIMSNEVKLATTIDRGRFNLVVHPHRDPLGSPGAGVLVVVLDDAGAIPLSTPRGAEGSLSTRLQARLAEPGGALLSWAPLRRQYVDRATADAWVLTEWSLGDALASRHGSVAAGAAFALLLGLLAGIGLLALFRRFDAMPQRVRDLVMDDSMTCHYQPIIALDSGRVIGCEALVRLLDGGRVLPPDQVLAHVISQGLHWELDRRVGRRAMREIAAALGPREGFHLAINLFPASIDATSIVDALDADFSACRALGYEVILEVTEYDYAGDVLEEIRSLSRQGYRIAVDDFGTGYSNLGWVKRLAPDVLKIDRSFVLDMEDATLRSSLIPEILTVARAVGSSVQAEGIENAYQQDRLVAMGVTAGQGYHLARPMPLEAFVAWLAHREAAERRPALARRA